MIGAAAVVGRALAFVLRTWLVKLSKSQLESRYVPLMQSLADADGLTAHCRGLVDARLKEERKRIAARRDDELKRAEENYRKAFAAAEAQRDEKLRKINEVYAERMVEVQTTQQRDMREALDEHDRRLAELRGQVETSLPKLDEKYKELKERLAAEPRDRLARHGRPLARGDEGGGRPSSMRSTARSTATARPGTTPSWAERAVAAGRSARDPLRDGPARARRPAARHRGRRPA